MEKRLLKIKDPQKITLDYIVEGEGKPILFLHGGGTDYRFYTQFLKVLSAKYKVYTFAYPGFGKSSNIKSYTLENFNQIINEFLRLNDLSEVYIVAHSMGAGLAVNYLSSKNKVAKVFGLCLISPWLFPVNKSLVKMIKDLSIQNNITLREVRESNQTQSLVSYLKKFIKIKYTINSLKLFLLIKKEDIRPFLSKINIPVLGFYGTSDIVLPSEDQKNALAEIKDCMIFKCDGGGHHLIHLQKDLILQEIIKIY